MKRIAVLAFMHESNTFASTPTTLRHFEEAHLNRGSDLVPVWEEAHHEIGGFLAGCRENGLEAVPILAAWATPGGPLTRETYDGLINEILFGLSQAGPIDGVLLALHGAMVAEGIDSADGETMERLREALGPRLPIVLTLDMHANVSPPMVERPNATIIYRTYPHIDQRARGVEAATLMKRMLEEGVKPVQAWRKLPLLVHIVQQYTEAGPMAEVFRCVREIADSPGILSASFAPGYIYADVPDMGAAAVVVADGNRNLAEAKVQELADYVFSIREELNANLPSPEEAVRQAANTPGTVSLMDCGDNIGGGGPGDSTLLFREVLHQSVRGCCVVLYDPKSVAACLEAGVGADIELLVGGKTDSRHGESVPIRGRIKVLSEGRFEEPEPRHGGARFLDQGKTAVIATEDGHTVVVNSLRVMPASLQQLLSLGIRPQAHKLLIVKGVTAPRAAYDPVSVKTIPVDTEGVTQAGPESFEFKRRPRPLFPLDEIPG